MRSLRLRRATELSLATEQMLQLRRGYSKKKSPPIAHISIARYTYVLEAWRTSVKTLDLSAVNRKGVKQRRRGQVPKSNGEIVATRYEILLAVSNRIVAVRIEKSRDGAAMTAQEYVRNSN